MFSFQRVCLFPPLNWRKIKEQIVETYWIYKLIFESIVFMKPVSINSNTNWLRPSEIPWKVLEKYRSSHQALSGAIRRSPREKLYHELGLKSLCLFYKIFKENKPVYLFNLIPTKNSNYNTRNTDKITLFHTKHNFFKNCFFPSPVIEWNMLDPNLRSVASLSVFRKNLLKFIRPSPNSAFNSHNCKKEWNTPQDYALV